MTEEEAGTRLDRLLQQHRPDLTRSHLKHLIQEGFVTLDGEKIKAGFAVKPGSDIELQIPPPPEITPEPEDIPLSVIYEDDDLLVVDKAAGLSVHPGAGRASGTMVNALLGRGTTLSPVGAPLRPGIVHRLDKDTSGLLVVAKTEVAHHSLTEQLAERSMSRRYWTMIWGLMEPKEGEIEGALARSRADRRKMRVVSRGGKPALTRYRTLWADQSLSILWVGLQTGRTHQIRAHFKSQGHSVFGDSDYGGRSKRVSIHAVGKRDRFRQALGILSRQALHAAYLSFTHPVSLERLDFTSPLPSDIMKAAKVLEVPGEVLDTSVMEEV